MSLLRDTGAPAKIMADLLRDDTGPLDLAAGGGGLVAPGTGPALDRAAQAAYQRRITEVTEALESADRAGDQAAERAGTERAALLRELRKSTGFGGRGREPSPEAERARVNVTRTLRAAVNRIGAAATTRRQAAPTAGWCALRNMVDIFAHQGVKKYPPSLTAQRKRPPRPDLGPVSVVPRSGLGGYAEPRLSGARSLKYA